jgi:phasin family protein
MATNQNPFEAFSQFFPQNNKFADFGKVTDMFKTNDMFKNLKSFGEFKAPNMDTSKLAQAGRRSFETASAAGQTAVENMQAITRRQAALARNQVETVLKSSKDMMSNGSPEINSGKQIEMVRGIMEGSLNNMREISEMVTKSNFEMFDVFNRHATEQLDGLAGNKKPAAKTAKKKAA